MTKEEYLQLVQNSEAFTALEAPLQKNVLEATGQRMERYAAIFLHGRELLMAAKKEFIQRNGEIQKKMTEDLKTVQKEKLKADETKAVAEDEQKEAALLEEINEL